MACMMAIAEKASTCRMGNHSEDMISKHVGCLKAVSDTNVSDSRSA